MDDYNSISGSIVDLFWADGVERHCLIMWAFWLSDQEEADKLCCSQSQCCKVCVCPKDRLHEPFTKFARRSAKEEEKKVRDAFKGIFPGQRGVLDRHPPLFKLGTCPSSGRPRWMPTKHCSNAIYEKVRKQLGLHLVENGLWRANYFDHLHQVLPFSGILFEHNMYLVCMNYDISLH
jgi:hypothetical protein